MTHILSHMTHSQPFAFQNESWHKYECVMSQVWMSHGTNMNESLHTYEWVIAHIWMSHGTHMNASCHKYEWVMSHKTRILSHMTHPSHMWHDSFILWYVTWLIHTSHMWQDASLRVSEYVTWIWMTGVSYMWQNESYVTWCKSYVTWPWRIHICAIASCHIWLILSHITHTCHIMSHVWLIHLWHAELFATPTLRLVGSLNL